MNIIIVGCGQVGVTLAEQLNEKDNNITVVDADMLTVKEVCDRLDLMGVVGNGATRSTLLDAGIENADLLIAVTNSDELNLLCCVIAKKTSNCRTIARVRSYEYHKETEYLRDELGLSLVINPELASASEIARVLRFPSALSIEPFAKGRVELIKFRLPEDSSIVGKSVKDVMLGNKHDILFATVERGDTAHIVTGSFVFEAKDVVSIIASPNNAGRFFKQIGYKTQAVKDALIIGGGEVTHYLCSILEDSGVSIKVIEKDYDTCEALSTEFPGVVVINDDTLDRPSLIEEGIDRTEAFLALTESDEENILLSLFGRSRTCGKVVTKIRRVDYDDVIKHLDLDTVIYTKNLVADSIARFVRATKNTQGSKMETLYNVIKGEIEASEFIIREPSEIVGKPLSTIKFKQDVIVGAIIRKSRVKIPRGNDTIEVGDAVVIVSRAMGLHDITDILESKQ